MIELAAQEIGKQVMESNLYKIAKGTPNLDTNVQNLDRPMAKDLAENKTSPESSVDEKQKKEIEKVESGEKILDGSEEKGNYGEMKVDQDLKGKGYNRISLDVTTGLDQPGHQGIDGVYYNENGKPQYLIVDAKYNTAQLDNTMDGKQMCDKWINKRLDNAVGKEMADKIRTEQLLNPDNVESYVGRVSVDGKVSYEKLNGDANVVEKGVKLGA